MGLPTIRIRKIKEDDSAITFSYLPSDTEDSGIIVFDKIQEQARIEKPSSDDTKKMIIGIKAISKILAKIAEGKLDGEFVIR